MNIKEKFQQFKNSYWQFSGNAKLYLYYIRRNDKYLKIGYISILIISLMAGVLYTQKPRQSRKSLAADEPCTLEADQRCNTYTDTVLGEVTKVQICTDGLWIDGETCGPSADTVNGKCAVNDGVAQCFTKIPQLSGLTPVTITTGTRVSLNSFITDDDGLNNIERVYLGISPCSLDPASANSSNFERQLSKYFGAYIKLSDKTGAIAKYYPTDSCDSTSGNAPWDYFTNMDNINKSNANNSLTLTSVTTSTDVNELSVNWNVNFTSNFPTGNYYYYFMLQDKSGLWHNGTTSAGWNQSRVLTVCNTSPCQLILPTPTETPSPSAIPAICSSPAMCQTSPCSPGYSQIPASGCGTGEVCCNPSTATIAYNVADINRDGVVNIQDYILLSNSFNTGNSAADLNKDGTVNIQDYIILSNNFGR